MRIFINSLSSYHIESECEYVLWFKIDKELLCTVEDMFTLGQYTSHNRILIIVKIIYTYGKKLGNTLINCKLFSREKILMF